MMYKCHGMMQYEDRRIQKGLSALNNYIKMTQTT